MDPKVIAGPSSSRQFRLGLNLPYAEGQMDGHAPRWTDIVGMARAAEAMGFDSIWISDHMAFEGDDGIWQGAWESWTLLTAVAASTTRVELGTYVSCVPFRNPALFAKMAETLDEISAGRVILGLGAGWNKPEFKAFGFPFEDRFNRFEDGLRIIRALLSTGRSDHDGRASKTDGALLSPRGPRPLGLPIMVGATGPRMLRLTAELADHWNGGLVLPEEIPPLLSLVNGACKTVGRDPVTLTRSVEALVRTLPAGDDKPLEERELRGEPSHLASLIRRYAALGIDHVQVQLRPRTIEGLYAFKPIMELLNKAEP